MKPFIYLVNVFVAAYAMLSHDTTAVLIIVARNNLFLPVRELREVV